MDKEKKSPSFKIKVSVTPKWNVIAQWCFPDLKNKSNEEIHNFVINLKKELEQVDSALFGKSYFQFVDFFDSVSGLNLIWSDYEKTFINELAVWGTLFGRAPFERLIKEKDSTPTALKKRIVISPRWYLR